MKTMHIDKLIEECKVKMYSSGYSDAVIERHFLWWQKGICAYMKKNSITDYTTTIGNDYLQIATKGYSKSVVRGKIRNIHILDQYLEYGVIATREKDFCKYPLPGKLGEIAQVYIDMRKEDGLRPLTIVHHKRNLSLLIASMIVKGIKSYDDLNNDYVLDFVNNGPQNRSRLYTIISFTNFLFRRRYITQELSKAFDGYRAKRIVRLPSYYDREDIAKLESCIDQDTSVGIRNYAVILLMSRLGLRSSDVAALKFNDINWDENKICIVQQKTGRPLELPLPVVVGNAIVRYIKFVRPRTDFNEIFCKVNSPLGPLNDMSINSIVRTAFKNAGICTENKHFGAHSLRHSLATNMLSNGVPLPTISGILGHARCETTLSYLKIDTRSLRECAIEVPQVDNKFYNQRGGIFYV